METASPAEGGSCPFWIRQDCGYGCRALYAVKERESRFSGNTGEVSGLKDGVFTDCGKNKGDAMRRKKIGVFIGGVTQNFSGRVCRTISRRAEALGYDVYFFTTFNSYDDNLLYLDGECKIFDLPEYSELDGIIVAPDTIYLQGRLEVLYRKLKAAPCPVVSIRERLEGVYNVVVDDSTSMEKIICHFIEEHKFTNICFMSGRMDLEDGRKRLECYKRVMAEHGLCVTDDMIYYGDYWKEKGEAAAEHFLSGRKGTLPQAIVCANDFMAISVMGALERRGIRVPEDICVSGFDDVIESLQSVPTLSTVRVSFEDMAERAVDTIDALFRGEQPDKIQYVSTLERYRGSCGCCWHEEKSKWFSMVKEIEQKREVIYQSTFMNADMEGITDEKTLLQMANKYSFGEATKKVWICLCDESEELTEEDRNVGEVRRELTQKMMLRSVKSADKGLQLMEKPFERRELIPEEERAELPTASIYFTLIHYKNRILGYVASTFSDYETYNDMLQPWTMVFSVGVEHYRLHERLNAMEDIKRLYKEDALTGIYNRRGFEEHARKLYSEAAEKKSRVAVICIDMDNLKKINDAFGHNCGDDALCRVARALENMAAKDMVYARTGGDEFCVVMLIDQPGAGSDYVMQLREELVNVNKAGSQNYSAEISCGVHEVKDACRTSLIKALEMSDGHMYEDKRRRKALRRD